MIQEYITSELRRCEQKKEYCRQHFDDYKDDEYNCVEMKFIYGIKSNEDNSNDPSSFCTLNDFVIYYNRLNNVYYADIDVSINNEQDDLIHIKHDLFDYIKANNLMMPVEDIISDATLIKFESDDLKKLCNYAYILISGMCEYCGR